MNYLTARLYALAGVPVGRASSSDEFDLGPQVWISYERGWRYNDATSSRPLTPSDLSADDYAATDYVTPVNWGELPNINKQPDFPANHFNKTAPTFDPLDPRPSSS